MIERLKFLFLVGGFAFERKSSSTTVAQSQGSFAHCLSLPVALSSDLHRAAVGTLRRSASFHVLLTSF